MYIYAYYLLTTLSNWAMHHKQIEFLKCYIARIIPHLMIYQQCKMHSRVYIVYSILLLSTPSFYAPPSIYPSATPRMYCVYTYGGRRVLEFLVLKQSISKKIYTCSVRHSITSFFQFPFADPFLLN